MIDLAVASRIANDLVARQFAGPARRTTRGAAAAAPAAPASWAPVRRAAVHTLRAFADRLEPAPRCAPQP
jgi:hypothetical protein